MIILPRQSKYADSGVDYVVLPISLTKRTFPFVAEEGITAFAEEEQDIGTIFVGAINAKDPVIKAILEATMEDKLIHPAVYYSNGSPSPYQQQQPQQYDIEYDNYDKHYRLPEGFTESGEQITKHCFDWACPFCFAPLKELDNKEPEYFYLGLPFDAPEAVKLRANKKRVKELKRLKRLVQASMLTMEVMSIMSSMPEYYDTLQ